MIEVGTFAATPEEEPFPGVRRRSFDAEGATVTEYRFEPGATFPRHRHAQEQITMVAAGTVSMTIEGEASEIGPGGYSVVGPQVEHGITAGPEGARFLAVVTPRRGARDEYEVE
ncbi:MAG TPA: cupin domain-containing protein [Solirubrobacterales bacterium]|nr:cupin domain-containing protein [Solirubrobacterales bacterium]